MPPRNRRIYSCFIAAVNQATDEDVLEMVTSWAVSVGGLGAQIQIADMYSQSERGELWHAPTHEINPSHIIWAGWVGRSRWHSCFLLTDAKAKGMEHSFCWQQKKRNREICY